jgi:competence protein ComEA
MEAGLPRPAPRRPIAQRVREWIDWFGPSRLIATAAALVAVVVGGVWLLRDSPPRLEDSLPYARATTQPATASTDVPGRGAPSSSLPITIVVYVTGAVVAPGVYTLPGGTRVEAAVAIAGGSTTDADLGVLNLAAPLHDGQRVFVPRAGQAVPAELPPATSPGVDTPSGPVNINTADTNELDALPGVGPATAAAIIARRQEKGPFQSVDDLADVRGIGPAKLAALRDLVTV